MCYSRPGLQGVLLTPPRPIISSFLQTHRTSRDMKCCLQGTPPPPPVVCGSAWVAALWVCCGPARGCCAGHCEAKPGKWSALRVSPVAGSQSLEAVQRDLLVSFLLGDFSS